MRHWFSLRHKQVLEEALFRPGVDVHRTVAAWFYGVKPEEVTKEQRDDAKDKNYQYLYGS